MASTYASAAKAIKAELKAAFPGCKFSVKSESFSMGDAVRIEWVDGPIADAVTAISDKYQYGSVNCMEDYYENTNVRADIPQTKYVTTYRAMSDAIKSEISNTLSLVGGDLDETNGNDYNITLIRRHFNTISL